MQMIAEFRYSKQRARLLERNKTSIEIGMEKKEKSAHVLNSASQGVWGVFRRIVVDLIHATKFDQLTPHVLLTGRLALVDVTGANKLFALLEDSISGIRCNASQRNPFLASITCPMWRTALECWGKAPYFAKKGPPSA
jgi:hypothetical protein